VNLPLETPPQVKAAVAAKGKRWVLLVVTVLAVAATGTLATWQLRRAAFKEALTLQIQTSDQLAPIGQINQLISPSGENVSQSTALIHRRVVLTGKWLDDYTVFLDNRFMAGRPGFYVVTPLQQDDGGAVVWVQRGWLPRNVQDRTRLPAVPTSNQVVQVQGRVTAGVSKAYALGEAPSGSALGSTGASRIWQNLPNVDFGVKTMVASVAVLQTASPALEDGLLRDWPQADAGVAKHYGYAFQWFALCGLIIALYVWFQILAPRRRKS
jgi:surfeit locus 1 family protein